MTDANLCLGRLLPGYFPCIFGPREDQPLSQAASRQAFQELTAHVNACQGPGSTLSLEEVAMGFVRVANEAMCRPIRALTQVRGCGPFCWPLPQQWGASGGVWGVERGTPWESLTQEPRASQGSCCPGGGGGPGEGASTWV